MLLTDKLIVSSRWSGLGNGDIELASQNTESFGDRVI